MFWCVTVPSPMFGSHIDGARSSRRVGSRYRYCLVSAATLPGAVSSGGMYASAARSEYPRTRRPRAEAGGAAGDPRTPVQTQELLVAHVTREPDPPVGTGLTQLGLEVVAAVPLADDHRLEPGLLCLDPYEDLDQLLEPLDRDEPAGRDDERR